MKNRAISIFNVLLVFTIFSCNTNQVSSAQVEKATEGAPLVAEAVFGDPINTDNAIPYAALLTKLPANDSLATKVHGTVAEVCQAKGCWMTIVYPDAPSMMVKFKDYGFFVPKDISGREVVMEGYAYKSVTSVEELQHYAEDAGKSKEEIAKITTPKEELKFLASGVALLK